MDADSPMGSLVGAGGHNAEAVALREQLQNSQETSRRLLSENESLREELKRRSDLLVKKDGAQVAQAKRLEAAEKKIRELVRSGGEADYKSRALAAKVASVEKSLDEAVRVRKALEKKLQNRDLQLAELNNQNQSQSDRLEQLASVSEQRGQSAENLEQQNRDLEIKLSRAIGKVELYQGKIASLQRQLGDKQTEQEMVAQRLDAAEGERDLLRRELDESRKQGRSYRENLTGMEQMLASNRRQLGEVEDSLERTKVSLHRAETAHKAAQDEAEQLRQDLDARNQELEQARAREESLQEQFSQSEREQGESHLKLSGELEASQAELVRLQAQIAELEAINSQDKSSAQALRKEREALGRELETQRLQLEELGRWAEKIKPAYETLKERHVTLLAEQKATVAKLDALKQQHSEVRSESEQLEDQQRDVVRQLAEMETERDDLLSAKAELEARLEQAETDRQEQLQLLSEEGDKNSQLREDLLQERERSTQLQDKLDKTEHTLASLDNEKKHLLDKLKQLSEDRLSAKQRSGNLESQLDKAEEKVENLTRDLAARSEELSATVEEIAQHQALAAKSQTNVKELLRQRTQLLDNKRLLESQLESAERYEQEAEARIQGLEGERDRLSHELETLNEQLDESNANLRSNINSLEERLVEETGARQRSDQELEELKELSARKDAEYSQAVSELEEALARAGEERRDLEHDLEMLGQDLEHSRNRVGELEIALESERVQSASLRDELEQSTRENQNLMERSRALEADIETLQEEIRTRQEESERQLQAQAELEQEIERLKTSRDDLNRDKTQLQSQLTRSQKEALGLREYIDKLSGVTRERLEQAKAALEKREKQLHKYRDALTAKASQLKALEQKFERSQMAESAYRGALLDLRTMLVEKEEMIEEAEWHLGLVYTTLEEGQTDLEQTQAELKSTRTDLDQTQAELGQTKSELEQTQSELNQTRDELEETRGDLAQTRSELEQTRDDLGRTSDTLGQTREELDSSRLRGEELETQLAEVRELHLSTQLRLEQEEAHLAHVRDNLDRAETRLDGLYQELEEEQARSASMGAQLSDALEERNRSAGRLRELHQEFQDWRDAHFSGQSDGADDGRLLAATDRANSLARELAEVEEQLAQSAARERELNSRLESLESEQTDPDHFEELNQELILAQSRTSELETELADARLQLVRLADGAEPTSTEELEAELELARSRAEATALELDELRRELESREREKNLQESLGGMAMAANLDGDRELERELERVRKQAETSELQVAELEIAIEESRLQVGSLEQALEQAKQQLESARSEESGEGLVLAVDLEANMLRGYDMGAELISAQLDNFETQARKDELVQKMEKVETRDDLAELMDEMAQVDQLLSQRGETFDRLECEWNDFLTELDETSQVLLHKFTGLIEYEMREARQSLGKAEALQREVVAARALAVEQEELHHRMLADKDAITEQLEEELSTLSSEVTDLNEQLLQQTTLQEDIQASIEEADFLEDIPPPPTFATRRASEPEPDAPMVLDFEAPTTEPLELESPGPDAPAQEVERGLLYEELRSISERYIRSRQRIHDLVGMLEERDRRLAELERDAELKRAPRPKPSLAEKLLRRTGFVSDVEPELDDEASELARFREKLQQKRDIFTFLDQQVSYSQDAVAQRMFELQQAGYHLEPEQEALIQEQLTDLQQEMDGRDSTLGRLEQELEEDDPHKTAEDLPAVPNSFDLEASEGSDPADSPGEARD